MRRLGLFGFFALWGWLAASFLFAGEGQAPDLETTYLAHFVNAPLDGGATQSTILVLSNPGEEAAQATLSFFSGNGDPVSLFVDGNEVEIVERTLAPGASSIVFTQSLEPVSGWIQVVSPETLRATGILSAFVPGLNREPGTPVVYSRIEASIFAVEATLRASVPVERSLPGFLFFPDLSTAVAVVNPSSQAARVTLTLLDDEASELFEVELVLEPRTQQARFVEELFPDIPLEQASFDAPFRFAGSLRVSSDTPIALTALRTQGGVQLSSPPVGQLRQVSP
ncbi:MAG TPA: hypothetical protein VLU25_02630 [Acidobacteriota bacterium]|nr:hypothetical protein [Acidobacteriota bacterium]